MQLSHVLKILDSKEIMIFTINCKDEEDVTDLVSMKIHIGSRYDSQALRKFLVASFNNSTWHFNKITNSRNQFAKKGLQ